MSRIQSFALAGLSLMLAPHVAAGRAATDAPSYSYVYQGSAVPLVLDSGRIGFRADVDELAARLAPFGVPADGIRATPVPGWALATAPEELRDDAAVEALIRLIGEAQPDFVTPVFLDRFGGPLLISPEFFVAFHPWVAPDRIAAILDGTGAGTLIESDYARLPGVLRMRSGAPDGFAVLELVNGLAALPEVRFCEPDVMFTGRGGLVPNDAAWPDCWGFDNTGQSGGTPDVDMDIPEAWDVTTGDPSVLVVVIDSGVQPDHPDLVVAPGADVTADGPGVGAPVNPCDNHGTPVAGCIAATINNAIGTVGAAPTCTTASVRAFISEPACDGSWCSFASWTVDALSWAEQAGARVTNNSNQYGFMSSVIDAKYAGTRSAGMIHFASAGNFAATALDYPASLSSINAIGAVGRTGEKSSFSSCGSGLFMMAPGEDVSTVDRTGLAGWSPDDYIVFGGTSLSSPYAAAVSALVLSAYPSLGVGMLESILANGAVDLGAPGYETTHGWGLVNADRSLQCAADCVFPANDDCAGAIDIVGGPTFASNVNATTGGPLESLCAASGAAPVASDIWFRYEAPCDGAVGLILCESAFDAEVAVYQSSCPALPNLAIACEETCAPETVMEFDAIGGLPYYIRVGGVGGAQGAVELFVAEPACGPVSPNDECGTAFTIQAGATSITTAGATSAGPDEAACLGPTPILNDAWYRWFSGDCEGALTVSVEASFPEAIAVYGSGCPFGADTAIDCAAGTGSGAEVAIAVNPFTLYRIRVGSTDGSTGNATLTLQCDLPPPDCPGDADGSGVVDVDDIVLVVLAFGGTAEPGRGGDVDGNGVVDVDDIVMVVLNFGLVCS